MKQKWIQSRNWSGSYDIALVVPLNRRSIEWRRNGDAGNRETLQHLHSDIRRLIVLAFPKLEDRARETMACDYFIDALNDPMLELKIREKAPRCLDAVYKEALNLEMWQQC